MCDVENRPQKTQRRDLRPRAHRQTVCERLDVGAGDLIDGHVTKAWFDAQFPVLGVAAPGLRRHRRLLGVGELRPDPVERRSAKARIEPPCAQRRFIVSFGLECLRLAQRRERRGRFDPAGWDVGVADQVADLVAGLPGLVEASPNAARRVAGHYRRTCLSRDRTSAQSQRRTRSDKV